MATTSGDARQHACLSPHLDSHHIFHHNGGSSKPRKGSSSSAASNDASMKSHKDSNLRRQKTHSSSSRNTVISSHSRPENPASNKPPRSLPPWIDSNEVGDEQRGSKPTDRLLPPSPAHSAQHHHTTASPTRRVSQDGYVDEYDAAPTNTTKRTETGFFGGKRQPVRGRKWDHARDKEPVIMQSNRSNVGPQWSTYIKSSQYGPGLSEDAKQVDEDFLRNQTPGYERPWRGDLDDDADPEKYGSIFRNKKKQRTLVKRLQRNLLVSPYVPFVLRSIVLVTSVLALSISGSIYHLSNNYDYSQNPSTTMAVVVDVVAIPYISYITYDEYRGKPLGLRPAKTKIRLVLLDLFFIIFESANLALAFASLTDDNGACRFGPTNPPNKNVCDRTKTLCAILFIALLAWSLTFAVSIFRLVERIGGREDMD